MLTFSKTVQDIVIYVQWKSDRKSYMTYQMASSQWPSMTLKVIHRLHDFSNVIRRTFVLHFTRFQLKLCSRGLSASAVHLASNDLKECGCIHYVSICNAYVPDASHNISLTLLRYISDFLKRKYLTFMAIISFWFIIYQQVIKKCDGSPHHRGQISYEKCECETWLSRQP